MIKILKFINIFFRIRMYFIKKRSIKGMKRFLKGYKFHCSTLDLTPEQQKIKNDIIWKFEDEMYELEKSFDSYVYRYTHNID